MMNKRTNGQSGEVNSDVRLFLESKKLPGPDNIIGKQRIAVALNRFGLHMCPDAAHEMHQEVLAQSQGPEIGNQEEKDNHGPVNHKPICKRRTNRPVLFRRHLAPQAVRVVR